MSLNTTPGSTYNTPTGNTELPFAWEEPHSILDQFEEFQAFRQKILGNPIFIIQHSKNQPQQSRWSNTPLSKKNEVSNEASGDVCHGLHQLTVKVLEFLAWHRNPRILLSELMEETGGKRRRLADILSVLESLSVVRKLRYNVYEWLQLCSVRRVLRNYPQRYAVFMKTDHLKNDMRDMAQHVVTQFETVSTTFTLGGLLESVMAAAKKNHDDVMNCKRRVYEILAVMAGLGLVVRATDQNVGHYYAWLGINGFVQIVSNIRGMNEQSHSSCETVKKEQHIDSESSIQQQESLKDQKAKIIANPIKMESAL